MKVTDIAGLAADSLRRTYELCLQGDGVPQVVIHEGLLYFREGDGSVTVTAVDLGAAPEDDIT